MCTSKTPKVDSAKATFLTNPYLDGTSGSTGIAIGRSQLRSPSSTRFGGGAIQTAMASAGINVGGSFPQIGVR